MKINKQKLCIGVSIIIGLLLNTSITVNINSQAAIEEDSQRASINTDYSTWKWTVAEVVSTESTADSGFSSLVVDSKGNVHVAWYDSTDYAGSGTDNDIFYRRWDVSSSNWTTTEVVSTESTALSAHPSLAVDYKGNVHVAWTDFTNYNGAGSDEDIFYKRWDVSSSSWTTTEILSNDSTSSSSIIPSLAADYKGNVHVVWMDNANYAGSGTDQDIFYKRWDVSSSNWTITEVVSTESTANSNTPSLAVDSKGNVHVAWYDYTDYAGSGTDTDIFYKRWDVSSSTWTLTEVVSTESTTWSTEPCLDVDSAKNVHIAWQDSTDYAGSGTDTDIFYKRWDVSSSTWTLTEVVSTESTKGSYHSPLVVDSAGNVHIAWGDYTNYNGAGSDEDIFYKRWDAFTSSWTSTEIVSSESSTSSSIFTSFAVDTCGNVYIAYEDFTNYAGCGDDKDIFYKVLTGPPATPELAFIVPNPIDSSSIYLDWNSVTWANSYYIYRSSSYIWSVNGLSPVVTVSSSEYEDIVPSEGFYYYVIVAGNLAGNSSHSNCQFVEVRIADLPPPELATIIPNPTDISNVFLDWNDIDGAIEYYVYRSTSYIWSVEGLTPIAITISSTHTDSLPAEGYFFYVIVATDGVRNSTASNCAYIHYEVPHLREFTLITGLIVSAFVISLIVIRKRKNR